ncbi:YIP1 family protein [uncultured Planktosalinus sp.]|uniref:YIP1 family protein n=1 Tax=uncultured Planktosalinus sp. TaxID=1810935 RepID=UPI0030DCE6DC
MKTTLFNPFKKYTEYQLVFIGLITAGLGILAASYTNTHFDGVLDTHFANDVSLITACIESLFNLLSIVVVFFILGKFINSKTRLIDIVNLALIVKIPAYFLLPLNINNWIHTKTFHLLEAFGNPTKINFSNTDIFILIGVGAASLVVLIWFFVLLYNGFKIAVNLKTTKHKILFVAGIILAEITSKTLINQIVL